MKSAYLRPLQLMLFLFCSSNVLAQINSVSMSLRAAQTVPPANILRPDVGELLDIKRTRPRPGFAIGYTKLSGQVGFRVGLEATPANFILENISNASGGGSVAVSISPYYRNVALPFRVLYRLGKLAPYAPKQWQWAVSAGPQLSWITETGYRNRLTLDGRGAYNVSFKNTMAFESLLRPGFTAGVNLFRKPHKKWFPEVSLNWLCTVNATQPWRSTATINSSRTLAVETTTRTLHWIHLDVTYHYSLR